uniref:C-type lectin domain-containing protein n=1 Tax=Neogobius melanostomus TaxID=47308 RepID=A0A8C6S4W8_9GOBI
MNNVCPTVSVPTYPNNVAQCAEDWELHGTKCYYFSPLSAKLPWKESRKMCQKLKGDLVKIESREEQVCTQKYRTQCCSQGEVETIVHLQRRYLSHLLYSVVETSTTEYMLSDYSSLPVSCFHEVCEVTHGSNSDDPPAMHFSNEFLDGKLQTEMIDNGDKFWIGLTDSEAEGQWVWTDGSPLNSSLAFWADNDDNKEPDNWTVEDPEGEDCVRMGQKPFIEGLKWWYDRSCQIEQRSICEKTAKIL